MRRIDWVVFVFLLSAINARAATVTSFWRNVTGSWTNSLSWSNAPAIGSFPNNAGTLTYDAVVGGFTVATLDPPIIIQRFTQTGSVISGGGSLTANELWLWGGGTMQVTGTNVAAGGLSITGNVSLINGGLISPVSSTQSNGNLTGGNGALLSNPAAVTYTIRDDSDLPNNASAVKPIFANAGTLLKAGGTNVTLIGFNLNNSGTVRVNSGTLQVDSFAGVSSGVMTTLPPGTIQFTRNYTLDGGTLSGGGTVNFNTDNHGSVTLSNTVTSTVATIVHTDGVVGGPGNLNHSGLFIFAGGGESGTGTNRLTGPLVINVATPVDPPDLIQRTLIPLGGTTLTNGIFNGNSGATVSNAPGVTFTIQDDSSVVDSGGIQPIFVNAGTLVKAGASNNVTGGTVGIGNSVISLALSNSGVVRAGIGTLRISGGGRNTGIFTAAPPARIQFTAGYTFDGGTLSGGGVIEIANDNLGTVIWTNLITSSVATLRHTDGVIDGPGSIVHSGLYEFLGGAEQGTGTNLLTGPLVIRMVTAADPPDLNARTMIIAGPGTLNNGTFTLGASATISNTPTGSLDILDDASILLSGAPGQRFYHNAGTLKKSGSGNNASRQGTNISVVATVLTNSGTVCGESGTLRFINGYFQTGGATKVNNGTISSATPLNIFGGSVIGTGIISNTVLNSGTISPGLGGAGSLTFYGALTNMASATFFTELGGYTQGTSYDFLTVTNRALLAGNLLTKFINNYSFIGTVTNGASFTVLTCSNILAGAFANVASSGILTSVDEYASFTVTYAADNHVKLNGLTILDYDADGIPNWWTDQHFGHLTGQAGDQSLPGDDPDGDGFTNLQEFEAGTNPRDSNSGLRITAVTREGNDLRITWRASGIRTNRLQSTTGGAGGSYSNNFTDITGDIVIPVFGDVVTNFLHSGAAGGATTSRYYRVQLIQ